MNSKPISPRNEPHLTPANLVGRRFGKEAFKGITVALVGYSPRPQNLDQYNPRNTSDQYFIHVPPGNVQICDHDGMEFISISHVYGGPVSSALIEELAYYEFKYVLAYGLAGGLGTKNLKLGDFYIVEKALALDGTTPHYTNDKLISSDGFLNSKVKDLAKKIGLSEMMPVQAMTADAIYREYDQDLNYGKENGCDIVNCDSSHLFAVSRDVGIKSTECGVISDVVMSIGGEWKSTLSVMLSSNGESTQNPLELLEKITGFYIEILIPELIH